MKMVFCQNNCCGTCLIFFRKLCICSVLRNNHYKTLGLSPSATQAEIKSAYYELSKKHHPDRNQGSEKSAKIFRDISAAYEILGNEKMRKKYDESRPFGNFVDPTENFDTSSRGYNDDLERMYYERRQRRFHRRYYYGKTPYYDFDAWYRAHYGKNPYNDADSWLRGPFGKNSYQEFEKWYKSQHKQNNQFTYKDGFYKSYKQSTESMKKRDSFFHKTENTILLIFYISIFATLLMRM